MEHEDRRYGSRAPETPRTVLQAVKTPGAVIAYVVPEGTTYKALEHSREVDADA
jgi:hypothetical protein